MLEIVDTQDQLAAQSIAGLWPNLQDTLNLLGLSSRGPPTCSPIEEAAGPQVFSPAECRPKFGAVSFRIFCCVLPFLDRPPLRRRRLALLNHRGAFLVVKRDTASLLAQSRARRTLLADEQEIEFNTPPIF